MLRLLAQTLRSATNSAKITSAISQDVATSSVQTFNTRLFSVTSARSLKEIQQVTEGNVTKIEGKIIPSERSLNLLKKEEDFTGCPLCKIQSQLKYTDVLILSQFLRPDGCVLPRRVTGVCVKQQRKLETLVHQAQRAGLLPQFRKPLPNGKVRTSHMSNYKWKRYNVYFKD